MKTYTARAEDIEQEWFLVNAEGKTLGRLASEIAQVLRGKHKPIYTPHLDCGDFVIVVNAEKVRVTGRKLDQKMLSWRDQKHQLEESVAEAPKAGVGGCGAGDAAQEPVGSEDV